MTAIQAAIFEAPSISPPIFSSPLFEKLIKLVLITKHISPKMAAIDRTLL